jgi:hypothetical protein
VETRGRVLLVVLVLLVGTTVLVLVFDPGSSPRQKAASVAFQKQVGGLGFGASLDLAGCAFGFDPRLDSSCSESSGPVAGGACFCPRHLGLVSYPPRGPDADATLP